VTAKTPGSGRKKGTPNKAKQELQALLAERYPDYHPVLAMAALANDSSTKSVRDVGTGKRRTVPKVPLELRARMHQEVAKYVEPQLKAIEHRAGDDSKGLNFFMGFTDQRVVSRPEVKGNGKANGPDGADGVGPARPRPRAGQ
jgi:hypothetical protein